jgi:uncharacterized protein YggE
MTNVSKIWGAAAVGVAAISLAACGGGGSSHTATPLADTTPSSSPNGPSIVVAGTGNAQGTPDTATVTMGVETHNQSAQTAMNDNNTEADLLIQALEGKGVAKKDIQTSDLSVSPDYDKDGHITGYGVDDTVTVTIHSIPNAGSIIDAAAAKVGNDIRMQSVTFSIENPSAQLAEARAAAVKDAKAQAEQLAAAAGVTLGSIRTIDDTGTEVPQPYSFYGHQAFDALNTAGSAAPTPVEPGQEQLSANVNVVYNIG